MASGKGKKRVEAPPVERKWLDLLATAGLAVAPSEVPEGWVTSEELSRIWNTSPATSRRRLKAMVDEGQVEAKFFKIMLDVVRPVRHYKISQ